MRTAFVSLDGICSPWYGLFISPTRYDELPHYSRGAREARTIVLRRFSDALAWRARSGVLSGDVGMGRAGCSCTYKFPRCGQEASAVEM